jgi:perosamine synthetase
VIPVFEPEIGEAEIRTVVAALRRGEISGSYGQSIPAFEQAFAEYVGRSYGVAVSSGTAALQLAVASAGIGEGDEVLVSASTNIATALAVVHNRAVPVPVDSEAVTWNLDLELLESLITPRTRAILPVHLYGHPVDMDRLMDIAERHGLVVIEDCAESHGATCRGRMTGSFGTLGCFSFYANKVITTGEGGMVVTDDAALAERLRLLRNLGFAQPRYRHELAGHNFRMTGLQAAMGLAQLERIDARIAAKRRLAHAYSDHLAGTAGLQLPVEMDWAYSVFWMYALCVLPEFPLSRDQLMASLGADGIDTRTFFCPMDQQPCLQSVPGFRAVPCPVAGKLWEQGLYLPSTPSLDPSTIEWIAGRVRLAAGQREPA